MLEARQYSSTRHLGRRPPPVGPETMDKRIHQRFGYSRREGHWSRAGLIPHPKPLSGRRRRTNPAGRGELFRTGRMPRPAHGGTVDVGAGWGVDTGNVGTPQTDQPTILGQSKVAGQVAARSPRKLENGCPEGPPHEYSANHRSLRFGRRTQHRLPRGTGQTPRSRTRMRLALSFKR